MSAVPVGCANDTTTLYEENTAIISTGNLVTGLGSVPLPPGGTINYTLVPPRAYAGDPAVPVTYLMTVNASFSVSVPPGQLDASELQLNVGGNPAVPNIDRDIFDGSISTLNANADPVVSFSGMVAISKNQSVELLIQRIGGNPAVTWTLEEVSSRSKRLA